jgi:hypothetical protein
MKNKDLIQKVAERYLESAKRDDPKMKNTGKGGLGTWFAGHGGGDPDDRATWGDWIAVTPVKHTIKKEDGEDKTYEPGDIVGPCAISSEPDWKDVTSGGKKPLKCMPREKAWQMSKDERADLAKKKRREEAKHRGKKPVNTPTFSEEAKEVTKKKASISRVSGVIKPPKKLVNDINDFLCHKVMLLLAYGPKEFRKRWSWGAIRYFKKQGFSSSEIKRAEGFKKGFFMEEFFEMPDYGIEPPSISNIDEITVAIEFVPGGNYSARWNPRHFELNLNILPFVAYGSKDGADPKLLCSFIKSSVVHELTHAMQTIMYHDPHTHLTNRGGFPTKSKTSPYNYYERKGVEYLASKFKENEVNLALHTLTPIEFYPLLLQEILGFRFLHQEKDIEPTNSDIREWISKRHFFKHIKVEPKLYRKAVGVFVDEVKKSKEEGLSYIKKKSHLYLQSAAQPAQDLAGVKTWVDKTRQDQINNDTSTPDKSREDYEDGKPQRDRVLPLPSGHPEGRDEQRVGPGVINSPPDSSGQGGANRPQKDPSALNDHPSGKALHERPRSSAMPGDEYGHPYIDQSQSTGLKRRVMGSIEEIEEYDYWDIDGDDLIKVGLFRYNYRPPKGDKRQREQRGQAKRKSERSQRKNRVKYRRNLMKQKRLYKRKKHNPSYKKYKKNYAKNPQLYSRRPGGGVSTTKQKNQRAEKRRKKASDD